jgi:hypothetical protein
MVKSAGSDRSGTYGTCRGGRSSLLFTLTDCN